MALHQVFDQISLVMRVSSKGPTYWRHKKKSNYLQHDISIISLQPMAVGVYCKVDEGKSATEKDNVRILMTWLCIVGLPLITQYEEIIITIRFTYFKHLEWVHICTNRMHCHARIKMISTLRHSCGFIRQDSSSTSAVLTWQSWHIRVTGVFLLLVQQRLLKQYLFLAQETVLRHFPSSKTLLLHPPPFQYSLPAYYLFPQTKKKKINKK